MNELMENLKRSFKPLLTSLNQGPEVPAKAPGSKALASWLTVRIAEISNLANPRLNLANACSPWALGVPYRLEKKFFEPWLN